MQGQKVKHRYYLFFMDKLLELKADGKYKIGRNKGNTVYLPHDSVSRQHSVIEWQNGKFIIQDLNSTNGTLVNKQKVAATGLSDGDSIQLGVYSLEFKVIDGKDSAIPFFLSPTMELEGELAKIIRDVDDKRLINKLYGVKKIFSKKEDRLLQLTYRDPLTGLYNRRFFNRSFSSEFNRAYRYNRPLSLLIIDIDHFKQVNDAHGHDRGDDVLRAVAKIIMNGLRRSDTACRFGGEEICVVLPETDAVAASYTAEKIRREIESESGKIAGIPVTVSIGVAGIGPSCDVMEKLFKAADKALYQAKHSGRNTVITG
ncbi:MAG: GGDEF domain-containing protein [Spirochaetales bacterium]|nr:GGDEF domain-containing protein [Spirochaetales bacterium]